MNGRTIAVVVIALAGCTEPSIGSRPALAAPSDPRPGLSNGDLVFQTSLSAQSEVLRRATGSAYTHMGVVFLRGGASSPWVLEAVGPVRWTPYASWVARGEGGRVVVRRLRTAATLLAPPVLDRMRALAANFIGRPYDPQFRWDDERLYCSELAHKLYERAAGVRIGRIQRAGEMNLGSPEVERALRQRFGGRFRPDEPVITPQAMFEDPALVTVFDRP